LWRKESFDSTAQQGVSFKDNNQGFSMDAMFDLEEYKIRTGIMDPPRPIQEKHLREAKYETIHLILFGRAAFYADRLEKEIKYHEPAYTKPSPDYCKKLYNSPDDDFLIWLMKCDPEQIDKNPIRREILKDLRTVLHYDRKINPPKFKVEHFPIIALSIATLGFGTLALEFRAEKALQRLKDNKIMAQSIRLS